MSDVALGGVVVDIQANIQPLEAALAQGEQRGRQFDRSLSDSLSKATSAALSKLSAQLGQTNASLAQIAATSERTAASLTRAFTAGASGVDRFTKSVNDNTAAVARAAAAQKQWNEWAGIGAASTRDRAADIAAYGSSLDALRAKFNPLFAAQQQYKSLLAEIAQAERVGAISSRERAAAVQTAKVGFIQTFNTITGAPSAGGAPTSGGSSGGGHGGHGGGGGAGVPGLNYVQVEELGHVVRSLVDSISAGQSPMRAFSMEGSRIAQVFSSGAGGVSGTLSAIGGIAVRAATSFVGLGLAAAGAAALVAGAAISFQSSQDRLQHSLQAGAGRLSGLSLGGANALAASGAAAGNLSIGTARDLVGGFAQAGIGEGVAGGLLASTRRFAGFTGQSISDAGGALAGGFSAPGTKGVALLDETFGQLNQRVVDDIRLLEQRGDREGAQARLQEAFQKALGQTTDQTWTLSRAATTAGNALLGLGDRFAAGVANMFRTPSLQEQMATAIGHLRDLQEEQGKRDASPLSGFLGTRGTKPQAITDAEKTITELSKKITEEEKKRYQETEDARTAAETRRLDGVVKGLTADAEEKRALDANVLSLQNLTGKTDEQRDALEKLTSAQSNWLDAIGKVREASAFASSATIAQTGAQRASIEADKARTDSLRASEGAAMAAARAEEVRNKFLAESQKALQDLTRDTDNQMRMRNLRPAQAEQERIRIEQENFKRNYQADGTAPAGGVPMASVARASGLNEDFLTKLRALMSAVPGISIGSGFRTTAEQARLYAEKPGLAAAPGHSNHEFGLAADLQFATPAARQQAHDLAGTYGLRFPMSYEPWHVEPVGARQMRLGMGAPASGGLTGAPGASADQQFARQSRAAAEDRATGLNSPFGQATDDLSAQRATLESLRGSWDHTTAAMAAAAEKQKLINDYTRDGTELTPALRQKIDELSGQYGKLAEDQESYQRSIQTGDFVRGQSTSLFSGVGRAIGSGKNAGEAIRQWGQNLGGSLIDKGAGMFTQSLFGKEGTPLGGLLGGLFGGGKQSTGSMSVQAGLVTVSGTSLLGGAGGAGGNIFNDLTKLATGGGAASGASAGLGGLFSFIPKLFGFAGGGIMSARGPLSLRRYAAGGVANSPQVAVYGEGDKSEAFVPLPDGRSIPVNIRVPAPASSPAGSRAPSSLIIQGGSVYVAGDVSEKNQNMIASAIAESEQRIGQHITRNLQEISIANQQYSR